MHITKIGHSCLLIEKEGTRIMVDPGAFSDASGYMEGIDAILITHKHKDHFDIEQIRQAAERNPDVRILTNADVGAELEKEGLAYEKASVGEETDVNGISVKSIEAPHEHIYEGIELPENTGYLIDGRLYHPGDSLSVPSEDIEILATPAAAPWGRISDFIDFMKNIRAQKTFPIHDGFLRISGPFHALPEKQLAQEGIDFTIVEAGESLDA